MVRLPLPLQKKLAFIFPDTKERDQFVATVVSNALEKNVSVEPDRAPTAIGGELHLYTDGGSRGNPGQAAIGCVLLDPHDGRVLKESYERIGIETNNIAEYRALIEGLKMAGEFQPNHLVCHLDSELVVKQLNGEYRVKMPTFQPLIEEILRLKSELRSVQFVAIPRSKNARADALVNRALDAKE